MDILEDNTVTGGLMALTAILMVYQGFTTYRMAKLLVLLYEAAMQSVTTRVKDPDQPGLK